MAHPGFLLVQEIVLTVAAFSTSQALQHFPARRAEFLTAPGSRHEVKATGGSENCRAQASQKEINNNFKIVTGYVPVYLVDGYNNITQPNLG